MLDDSPMESYNVVIRSSYPEALKRTFSMKERVVWANVVLVSDKSVKEHRKVEKTVKKMKSQKDYIIEKGAMLLRKGIDSVIFVRVYRGW